MMPDYTGMELTPKQQAAIIELESAFLRCKKAGLEMWFMDGSLFYIPVGYIPAGMSVWEATYNGTISQDDLENVDHHGCILDGGGW
jgi:hypothetical protein